MFWLGDKCGYLTDWLTQQWVKATGLRVSLMDHPWLNGPVGNTRIIGKAFFAGYAQTHGLELISTGKRGLLEDFAPLTPDPSDAAHVSPAVKDFYEQTSEYELDAWSQWQGGFRPFGAALATLFSRRLQQLNVPLSALDNSRGMTSEVLPMRDPSSRRLLQTAWVRQLRATGHVLYAGSYSLCQVSGYPHPCVKVVFPLPNGNAIVIMKPQVHPDGSFSVISSGRSFGDPGFYFVVHHGDGTVSARYLRTVRETITVHAAEPGIMRADHNLTIWRRPFLRLHYRMRRL